MKISRSRLRVRLLLALVASCFTLLLCECLARIFLSDELMNREDFATFSYHVTEGYEHIPNTVEERPGYTVRINSLGYRDREFSVQKPPGATRILVVGDSVPFGTWANVEDTFSKKLEAKLQSAYGRRIEVINGGNPDIGIAEMVRIFKKRDLPIRPDVALVCFYMNDSRPPMGFRSEFVGGNPVVRFVKKYPWTRRSMLFSFVYAKYCQWGVGREFKSLPISRRMEWLELFKDAPWQTEPSVLNELIETAQFDWGAAWRPETWPEVTQHFHELDRLCREHGIRPALIAMPVKVQVYASVQRHEPQQALARIANELGWPFLDVLPGLIQAKGGPDLFYDHCHYTAHGHEMVAEMLRSFLEEQHLVGESNPAAGRGPKHEGPSGP